MTDNSSLSTHNSCLTGGKPVMVLLIEDNPGDVRLIREMLAEVRGTPIALECVDRLQAGLERLAADGIDVVLLDLALPDCQGLDTFTTAYTRAPRVPIIVLTGLADEGVAVRAVRDGAQDYLVKGEVDGPLLVRALRYAIERKRAEEQIQVSLKEKEVLLKEIHHRVKNNLQVVSSLMSLQARSLKGQQGRTMFRDSEDRIKSMALVHEQLYQSKDLAKIDFAEYIQNLTAHLFRSYGVNSGVITLQIDVKDVSLDADTAIPAGLIITELVSNALKYAFPPGQEGDIRIDCRAETDGKVALMVRDNGVGFPKEVDFRKTESLGLQLVSTLTNQLKGTIELDGSAGTAFTMMFAGGPEKGRDSDHG